MDRAKEKIIIDQIRSGYTERYRELVDAYADNIIALIYKMTGCREDAEEMAQDVFVKAFFSIGKYRGDSSFSTWLFRIAYNLAITSLRKKKRIFYKDDMERAGDSLDDSSDNIRYKEIREEQYEALEKAMNELAPDDRSLLMLFYEEDKSLNELVEITGLTLSNVKIKMLRSRRRLAGILQEMGLQAVNG